MKNVYILGLLVMTFFACKKNNTSLPFKPKSYITKMVGSRTWVGTERDINQFKYYYYDTVYYSLSGEIDIEPVDSTKISFTGTSLQFHYSNTSTLVYTSSDEVNKTISFAGLYGTFNIETLTYNYGNNTMTFHQTGSAPATNDVKWVTDLHTP
jgi:hypothetical protein